jgi:pimeloyl-ACP methyl ester carboxylesterase
LRTLRAGRGDTTFLLLHGFGESLISFRALVDPLAQHYRVVAVDLPGFGLSDKPAGHYDLATTVARMQDFINRWTSGPVVVVGHSMGGEVAAALGLADPKRIVALVLIAPAGYALAPWLNDTAALGWLREGGIGSAIAYLLPMHDPVWLAEPANRLEYEPYLDPAYRGAARRVLAEFDFGALRERFRDLSQPVLLLWGSDDPTIAPSAGQAIVQELRRGSLVIIPGALHRPQETHPDQVLTAIQDFLGTGVKER